MGIKRKQSGPAPVYPHRWQELAIDVNRMDEARREYMKANRSATLIQAHRACAEHLRTHRQRYSTG